MGVQSGYDSSNMNAHQEFILLISAYEWTSSQMRLCTLNCTILSDSNGTHAAPLISSFFPPENQRLLFNYSSWRLQEIIAPLVIGGFLSPLPSSTSYFIGQKERG